MKVTIGLVNLNLRLLAGKCINNHTRGRSGKGRSWSCIVLERGIFGEVSCMQVIPFLCVFILDGALFGDDVKKFVTGLISYYIIWHWWLLRWGFGVVPAIIYQCNALPVLSAYVPMCEKGHLSISLTHALNSNLLSEAVLHIYEKCITEPCTFVKGPYLDPILQFLSSNLRLIGFWAECSTNAFVRVTIVFLKFKYISVNDQFIYKYMYIDQVRNFIKWHCYIVTGAMGFVDHCDKGRFWCSGSKKYFHEFTYFSLVYL